MTAIEALNNLRIGVEAFVGNWQQHRALQESLNTIKGVISSMQESDSLDSVERA
jgi:hypothetical protein